MPNLYTYVLFAILGILFKFYNKPPEPAIILGDSTIGENLQCRPFLPKLFEQTPPPPNHPEVRAGLEKLDSFISGRFSQGDIDALSFAVITSEGVIFERNFGVERANESETSPLATSHSSYRLASNSKLFAALEVTVLEQRGVLSWNDPVDKYLPDFTYKLDGFVPGARVPTPKEAPITILQLASHMSGMGRDWPPGVASNWPFSLGGGGPPPANGLPFPSHEDVYHAFASNKLVSAPWAYPSYSNTGIGLLGMTLVAANRMASENPDQEPSTYAELLSRDIFQPLNMNGSHFLATDENRHAVVVPSVHPEVADLDFLDATNAASGQFSSLRDCAEVVKFLLNPDIPSSLISRMSRDKWLQPVHDFEEDNWTQVGLVWEIVKARDSRNRLRKIYWKLGNVGGYHSAIAIHPGTSYGIVALMSSVYPDTGQIVYDAFEIMQPAIDNALAQLSEQLYAGSWKSADGYSLASIVVEEGTLWITQLILNGSDALEILRASNRVALRSLERRDEFRLDIGLSPYNGKKHMGCFPYWNALDYWGMRNGAPVNLIYFTGDGAERMLHVPSVDVGMTRY